MAKIPRTDLLAGPARQTRGVVNVPVVEESTAGARALAHAAKLAQDFGDRLYEADVDKKVTEANRKAREEIDREFRKLEESGDIKPEEFEGRFKEASDAIISRNAEIVPRGGRALWTERARAQLQSDGLLRTRTLKRNRELEGARAGIIEEQTALKTQVGDIALEEGTFRQNVQAQRNFIDRQVQGGFLGKDDAARMNAELDGYVIDDKTSRTEQNIAALVDQGRVAEADALLKGSYKELDPKRRAALERGLEASKFDNRVVTETDRLWAEAGGDYAAFTELTGDIEDAKLRTKVEERGDRLRLMAQAAENTRQDELEEQMWAHVSGGGTIGNASPALVGAIDPIRLGSIRAFENARDAEAAMGFSQRELWQQQSGAWKLELETMTPERFVGGYPAWTTDQKAKFDRMTPNDQRAINEEVTKRRTSGQTSNAVDGVYSDLVNELKRVAPDNWNIGTQKETKEATQMLGILRGHAKDQAKTGKPITSEDTRRIVAMAMGSKSKEPRTFGLMVDSLLRKGVEGEVAAGGIDPDLWADVEDTFYRSTGRKPTSGEALAVYKQVIEEGYQ